MQEIVWKIAHVGGPPVAARHPFLKLPQLQQLKLCRFTLYFDSCVLLLHDQLLVHSCCVIKLSSDIRHGMTAAAAGCLHGRRRLAELGTGWCVTRAWISGMGLGKAERLLAKHFGRQTGFGTQVAIVRLSATCPT